MGYLKGRCKDKKKNGMASVLFLAAEKMGYIQKLSGKLRIFAVRLLLGRVYRFYKDTEPTALRKIIGITENSDKQ